VYGFDCCRVYRDSKIEATTITSMHMKVLDANVISIGLEAVVGVGIIVCVGV
jgi:hypothetical protein